MAKLLTVTYIPNSDTVANHRNNLAKTIKISSMCAEGKVNANEFTIPGKFQTQRRFRDQAAVDEWVDFLRIVETRYGGTITQIEIKDVD